MDVLLTSADLAARLWITVRILDRQLAEAAIRGLKPGRSRLFTETDFETLVAYLDQRPTNLARATRPVCRSRCAVLSPDPPRRASTDSYYVRQRERYRTPRKRDQMNAEKPPLPRDVE